MKVVFFEPDPILDYVVDILKNHHNMIEVLEDLHDKDLESEIDDYLEDWK